MTPPVYGEWPESEDNEIAAIERALEYIQKRVWDEGHSATQVPEQPQ